MSDDGRQQAENGQPGNGRKASGGNGSQADDIRAQVEQRVKAEQESRDDDGRDGSGELSSKFIRECLHADELGDGVLYNTLHRGKFVYVKSMSQWLVWKGHHWAIDEMDAAYAATENVALEYRKEAERIRDEIQELKGKKDTESRIKRLEALQKQLYKRVKDMRKRHRRNNCLWAAHTCENPLAIHGREIDQKPWLMPCANGVVDLKTGRLCDGDPNDYMMRCCPTEYHGIDSDRSAWEKALMEIFEDDELVVDYMQRLFGYALVGAVYEHLFAVLTGPGGRNGKGTIIEMIARILGPLAGPIRSEMLLDTYQVQSSSGPTPDIMSLQGLRIAWASETKDGVRLSNAKVKWLTGGDTLTGRNPHDKYEVKFEPTHTLFLLSNYKPHLDSEDKALGERMQNIPFEVRFIKNRTPDPDKKERQADIHLKEKLMEQASGILGWLVEGCLRWQQEGLKPPPKVVNETDEYLADEDNYGAFIDYCLEVGEGCSIGASDLYDAFEYWWRRYVNRWPPKQKKFGKKMRERFECKRSTGGVYRYYGICLNDEWSEIMTAG